MTAVPTTGLVCDDLYVKLSILSVRIQSCWRVIKPGFINWIPEGMRATPWSVEAEGWGELNWVLRDPTLKSFFSCLPMPLDSFAVCGRSSTIVDKGKKQNNCIVRAQNIKQTRHDNRQYHTYAATTNKWNECLLAPLEFSSIKYGSHSSYSMTI